MRGRIAFLCLLACGAVNSEEQGRITPAQRIELGKRIALVDNAIDQQTRKLREAEASGDTTAVLAVRRNIRNLEIRKKSMEADEVLHWKKLEKSRNDAGRYWREPAEGEKEGKWVVYQEVVG